MDLYINTDEITTIASLLTIMINRMQYDVDVNCKGSGFSPEIIKKADFREVMINNIAPRLNNIISQLKNLRYVLYQACSIYENADRAIRSQAESERYIAALIAFSGAKNKGTDLEFSDVVNSAYGMTTNELKKYYEKVKSYLKTAKSTTKDTELKEVGDVASVILAITTNGEIIEKILNNDDLEITDLSKLYSADKGIIKAIIKYFVGNEDSNQSISKEFYEKLLPYFSIIDAISSDINFKNSIIEYAEACKGDDYDTILKKIDEMIENGFSTGSSFGSAAVLSIGGKSLLKKVSDSFGWITLGEVVAVFLTHVVVGIQQYSKDGISATEWCQLLIDSSLAGLQAMSPIGFDYQQVRDYLLGWANEASIHLADRGVNIGNWISVLVTDFGKAVTDFSMDLQNKSNYKTNETNRIVLPSESIYTRRNILSGT